MTDTIANNGLIPLYTIEDHIMVEDMDYQFYYDRIVKPDDSMSNCFALHYKEQQQEQWKTCKSLLSTLFTVAKTQNIIQQIQRNLEGNIENETHYRSGTSIKSSFLLSGYQVDIGDVSEADKLLFMLITNIDPSVDFLTTSTLSFNLINGFAGNLALQLNYGIFKNMHTTIGGEEKNLSINNIFILDRYTKRLIHDNHLSISIEDVSNVQRAIQTQIDEYQSTTVDSDFIDELLKLTPKRFSKQFIVLYDNLPSEMHTYYYITSIISSLLESERKISLEMRLRKFISTRFESDRYIEDEL